MIHPARAAIVITILALATPASGYGVGPAIALEQLAKTADLVCKATVVADRPVTDAWFEDISGFEVRDTELRVVSVIKGSRAVKRVHFHHYAPTTGPSSYSPQHYTFVTGRSYLVFAAKGTGGVYRQLSKSHTVKEDQGVLPAAGTKPHRGTTITEATWGELRALIASPTAEDAVAAITQLDQLSGGGRAKLTDLDRREALAAIQPMITSNDAAIATAAIAVFGADSPYFDDEQAVYWLAGVGKGTLAGLAPRTPSANPTADSAVKELLVVAERHPSAELRGLAIRALGRSHAIPAATLAAFSRDPEPAVRRAAVLVSAEHGDPKVITSAASDGAEQVRQAAALAIGFSQDAALLPGLDRLLKDAAPKVRMFAAMSVLAFAPDQATTVMKANLGSDYRALFVNALARRDPQPYLAMLAEVIEKRLQPTRDWWGGSIPAGDSWKILFEYVKTRPAAELPSGKLDRSLDALERMQWFSSSEPRDLYELYLKRGLPARAKRFREAARKTFSYNIDQYFDMVDKSLAPPPPPPPPAHVKHQVEDKVVGGVEGGMVGGVVGGPPPNDLGSPRPPNVPPTVLEASRIAGTKLIAPDDVTKVEIQAAGRDRLVGAFKLCLDPRGAVATVTTLKTTGFPAYDAKLLREMRAWRYKPYLIDGKAVPVCTAVTFIYTQSVAAPPAPKP